MPNQQEITAANELLSFIYDSPSIYHVVSNLAKKLDEAGFEELAENRRWKIQPGKSYYVRRNNSSLIAIRVPEGEADSFLVSAAHSDSPCFKIKENAELRNDSYVRVNTEKYGGAIFSTWFDRPLSAAGRVFVETENGIEERLVRLQDNLLIIPNVAIHQNRAVNDGVALKANVDTLPLLALGRDDVSINALAAEAAGVEPEKVLGKDLFLFCSERGCLAGARGDMMLSPRLDDLACATALLRGLMEAETVNQISVCCIFDNEEVGSGTKQGAGSTMIRDILRRLVTALGKDEEDFQILAANAVFVSADNAHAIHPNHPEYFDADNSPLINKGIVIKFNATQKYATDGKACAFFRSVCRKAGVGTQVFFNRSDLAGGGTLGSILSTVLPMNTVDIGLPQLAMHSAFETAGVSDYLSLIKAMTGFYEA